jgi:RNA polymerase sigma-70 factor (ECF subfamily)
VHELTEIIDGWLRELSGEERRLFLRRYWDGEPLEALAKERNVPPGTLAQQMYRLRARLRAKLELEGIAL